MTDPTDNGTDNGTDTEVQRLRRELAEEKTAHLHAYNRAAANGQGLIEARTEIEQLRVQLASAKALYTERARLLAFLAIQHDSVLSFSDPNEPEWAVLTIQPPDGSQAGQMTWHIHPGDLHLFAGIPFVEPTDPRAVWDGHDTGEKYRRLAVLVAEHRAWSSAEELGPVDEADRLLGELAAVDEKAAVDLQVRWMSAGDPLDTDGVIRFAQDQLQAAAQPSAPAKTTPTA